MKLLRVLIVEDSEDDSLLLIRELRRGEYDVAYERVETQESMKEALKRQWDVVISDYVLPVFSGLAALNVLKESNMDLPFIVVSGAIGEDIAVGAMKAGAHDYIMKGNLKRLVPAVERELKEAIVRRERKRAEEQLRRYLERLEQRNRDLRDFAHVASHDLQEPARKLQTFADLLGLHPECMDDKGRDYLERMKRAAKRMQDLILELLRYSAVTSELAPFTRFNLKDVVEEAVADLSELCAEVGGRIDVGELPDIEADRVQMRKLFLNLIENGLKYHGEQKPVIRIYAEPDSDSFREIHVKDNGIGFEETYLDKIFKPFQRLHAREVSYAGTGMGLAICRRIVERHEGSITARSKPGEGATFIVRLPSKQSEVNGGVLRDRLRNQ